VLCVTWLLLGSFESIPEEPEATTMIDGATRFGAFRRVILSLAAPGGLAAGLFAFTQAWNKFLSALVVIASVKPHTLPVGLPTFIIGASRWGLPQGLTAGSVKG
jgi:multiple sugar transport system permease protein